MPIHAPISSLMKETTSISDQRSFAFDRSPVALVMPTLRTQHNRHSFKWLIQTVSEQKTEVGYRSCDNQNRNLLSLNGAGS